MTELVPPDFLLLLAPSQKMLCILRFTRFEHSASDIVDEVTLGGVLPEPLLPWELSPLLQARLSPSTRNI